MINTAFQVNLFLEKRRLSKKQGNRHNLKIRIYDKTTQKETYIPTKYYFNQDEYKAITGPKPRGIYKEHKADLEAMLVYVKKVASTIEPFSADELKETLAIKKSNNRDVFSLLLQIEKEYKDLDKISTAETYNLTSKKIKTYLDYKNNKGNLLFTDVTVKWLRFFEQWIIDIDKKSITTLSIYLRCLRKAYNDAIDNRAYMVTSEHYPFGKKGYQIPMSANSKNALTKEQLQHLYKTTPTSTEQQKAKDFFFLSYALNGLNITDILNLKWIDIKEGKTIEIYRQKTKSTSTVSKKIEIPLNEVCNGVIELYGNQSSPYVFDVINDGMDADTKKRKTKAFTRFINQHIKKLAKANDLPDWISTYTARHTWATLQVNAAGAGIEFVSKQLGHTDIKTTQNYFKGFTDETKRQQSQKAVDLLNE